LKILWASQRKLVITALIIIIIITQFPSVAAQDGPESRLLNEISHDFSTDMIMILVETPNKWDATYGNDYNITNMDVLNEISSVEEALDPQKDDLGEEDEVFSVQSISVLIKEIYLSQRNVALAVSDELEIPIAGGIPGEYAIPQDQDEIDEIVSQIPEETRELFVRDTNDDGVWDTGVVWIAVTEHSSRIESDINYMIDIYYTDLNVLADDYNSRENWWERVQDGDVHCAMTNLGYTTSYESYYGPAQVLDAVLPFLIVVILLILTLMLIALSQPKKDSIQSEEKGKSSLKTVHIFMLVLIIICSSFVFINTSLSLSPELRQYSEEMGGGQIGIVLMRGNPAPTNTDEPTHGGGSMKDIDVLDDMDDMQEQLRRVAGISPYCIIDIMKTIRINESAIPDIVNQMPDPIQDRLNQSVGLSFWDAIHNANDDTTSPWSWIYGKSQQDSMINIFYNSLTIEMRSTFVAREFSRSLVYIQMPMEDPEDSSKMISEINDVVDHYPAGRSTSNVVLIGEQGLTLQGMAWVMEVLLLFVFMALGIVVFAVFFHKIRREGKGDDEDVQPFIPDYEIGLKGDYPETYDPYKRDPPPY
jgi:hypothetical protein